MRKPAEIYTHTHTHTHGCLCKIIISIFAILAITNPSYSTTVTGSGNECNENTLNTDTGPATLQAQWNANTINLNWYSDDTQITVPTASNTCTYDGGITLPTTNPTKEGYTFGGWRVRVAQCSLRDVDASIYGIDFGYIKSAIAQNNADTYHLTENGEWAAEFDYGVVKGISRCSTVGSGYTVGQTGEPIDDTNQDGAINCWCKLTGFDAEKDGEYCNLSSLWVFYRGDSSDTAGCVNNCVWRCGSNVSAFYDLRQAMFDVTQ